MPLFGEQARALSADRRLMPLTRAISFTFRAEF
jgi:hypothetical protein